MGRSQAACAVLVAVASLFQLSSAESCSLSSGDSAQDCAALLAIGTAWNLWSNVRTTGLSYCEWPYVSCNGDRRVRELHLNFNWDLNSSLPTSPGLSFFNPPSESYLAAIGPQGWSAPVNRRSTTLTGSIPAAIGNLTYLVILDLGGNTLSGTIPSALGITPAQGISWFFGAAGGVMTGGLPLLEYLDLGGNALTGTVPTTIANNFPNLRYINLTGNAGLTGAAPLFCNTTLMTQFSANQCALTMLYMAGSSYTSFPSPLSSTFNNLLSLVVSRNPSLTLNTSFFSALSSSAYQLQTLGVQNTGITGLLSAVVATYPNWVNYLDLSRNSLTGTIPAKNVDGGWGPSLQWLNISSQLRLWGSVPSSLSDLFVLDVSGNALSSVDPDFCPAGGIDKTSPAANATSLGGSMTFYCRNNYICTVPSCITATPAQFCGTACSPPSPPMPPPPRPPPAPPPITTCNLLAGDDQLECAAMRQLAAVWGGPWAGVANDGTSYCDWTGVQCDGNRRVVSISVVNIPNSPSTKFSGSIPTIIGNLTMLTTLRLVNHNLTGTIPATLGITNITALLNNYLPGVMNGLRPVSVGLPALQTLDLSMNALSGTIPASLGNSAGTLQSVSLFGNPLLTGASPIGCSGPILQQLSNAPTSLGANWQPCTCPLQSLLLFGLTGVTGVPSNLYTPTLCNGNNITLNQLNNLGLSYTGVRLTPAAVTTMVASLPALTQLSLAGSVLAGAGRTLANFGTALGAANIVLLDLSANGLTGTVPDVFANRNGAPFEYLSLQSNALTGTLPPSFSAVQFNGPLVLSNNSFGTTATFSAFVDSLPTSPAYLLLDRNSFAGTIPSNLRDRFPNLAFLNISRNFLTRNLPAGLQSIGVLDVSNNALTNIDDGFCPNLQQVLTPSTYPPSGVQPPASGSMILSCTGNFMCAVPACIVNGTTGNPIPPASLCGTICPPPSPSPPPPPRPPPPPPQPVANQLCVLLTSPPTATTRDALTADPGPDGSPGIPLALSVDSVIVTSGGAGTGTSYPQVEFVSRNNLAINCTSRQAASYATVVTRFWATTGPVPLDTMVPQPGSSSCGIGSSQPCAGPVLYSNFPASLLSSFTARFGVPSDSAGSSFAVAGFPARFTTNTTAWRILDASGAPFLGSYNREGLSFANDPTVPRFGVTPLTPAGMNSDPLSLNVICNACTAAVV